MYERTLRWTVACAVACVASGLTAGCQSPPATAVQAEHGDAGDAGEPDGSDAGDAGLLDLKAWLSDATRWRHIEDPQTEENQKCSLYEADPAGIALGALRWEPCGIGCLKTDPTIGSRMASNATISNEAGQGEAPRAFLAVSNHMPSAEGIQRIARRVIDLETGATISAIQITAPHPGGHQLLCGIQRRVTGSLNCRMPGGRGYRGQGSGAKVGEGGVL